MFFFAIYMDTIILFSIVMYFYKHFVVYKFICKEHYGILTVGLIQG